MSKQCMRHWQDAEIDDTIVFPDGSRKRIVKSTTLCSARIVYFDDGTTDRWYKRGPWDRLAIEIERDEHIVLDAEGHEQIVRGSELHLYDSDGNPKR